MLIGAVTSDHSKNTPFPWNTARVLNPDGSFGDYYDKNYPLLFGEHVPFVDPHWYVKKIPNATILNLGEGPSVLEIAGYRFGPTICYEDLLPGFNREVTREGIHALVNVTNDSWFGKNREQGEHLGLAMFRAIEQRRPLVRAVNAGISAYVDPAGRVTNKLPTTDSDQDGLQEPDGFIVDVPMMDPEKLSFYARTGHLFLFVMLGGLAFLAFRRPRKENEG